ncbi:MAG: glycosyltransferase family 2 protein [Candidatus Peribacteraceae bacterium]|nr:glycosyltransferase family 2 protein [Candidatus Peribacteraceae bacterium]
MSIIHYPLISVLVLNYRTPKDTMRCVEALRRQTIADRIEIIVIDNHSEDESIGWFRAQFGDTQTVRIVEQRGNLGYGRANNNGASFATGEYLLVLNPDNTLPPNALKEMLDFLKTHDDIGIVSPALVYADGTVRPSARAFPTIGDLLRKRIFPNAWQKRFDERHRYFNERKTIDVDWMVGACLLMRADLFRTLKGFDERFFLFFEDMDLCRRTKLLGKRVVYMPSVRVLDGKERLSGSSIFSLMTRKTTRIHLMSAIMYFWKWRRGGED